MRISTGRKKIARIGHIFMNVKGRDGRDTCAEAVRIQVQHISSSEKG